MAQKEAATIQTAETRFLRRVEGETVREKRIMNQTFRDNLQVKLPRGLVSSAASMVLTHDKDGKWAIPEANLCSGTPREKTEIWEDNTKISLQERNVDWNQAWER